MVQISNNTISDSINYFSNLRTHSCHFMVTRQLPHLQTLCSCSRQEEERSREGEFPPNSSDMELPDKTQDVQLNVSFRKIIIWILFVLKNLVIIYLKFTFNWVSCVFLSANSGNPVSTILLTFRNRVTCSLLSTRKAYWIKSFLMSSLSKRERQEQLVRKLSEPTYSICYMSGFPWSL